MLLSYKNKKAKMNMYSMLPSKYLEKGENDTVQTNKSSFWVEG